jgi:DNA processing protein
MILNTQSVPILKNLPCAVPGRSTVNVPGVGTLHVAGDVRLLESPGVAIVGSRRASHAGRALAAEVATELVRRGIVVVSGLAAGIDATAHETAIRAGGRTLAVIGTSLDEAYPRHHGSLQDQIARDHLVVSPFESGTPSARWHFPARNRVMARLARAMVLIEASETSGTRYQVQECIAVGKPVLVHGRLVDARPIGWLLALARRGQVALFWSMDEVGAHVAPVCGS